MKKYLLLAVLALVGAGDSSADDLWIIVTDVVITEPTDVENVIVAAGGSLTVRDVADPGLRVTGNIWAVADSSIHLENSVIQFMNIYHGQFALAAVDRATVEIVDCDYRVPNQVQHALVVAGDAELVIEDSDFGDVQLVSADKARIEARRLNGNFEVIVQNDSVMVLADVPRDDDGGVLWVWVEFPADSEAIYTPPMPGMIDHWSFPPEGSSGILQRVTLDRCKTLLWPMLIRSGSKLTLRDISEDNWVVVGFFLPNDAVIADLVNGAHYQNEVIEFDRELHLVDASIDTWNLYPEDEARIVVLDSVVGEILSLGSSRVRVEDSIIDGSGGFFGSRDQSQIVVYDSTITSTIEATHDSTIELHHSEVLPYPQDPTGAFTRFGAYDRARLFADQTAVTTTPALAGHGLIGVFFLVNPPSRPSSVPVSLFGTAALFSLDGGPEMALWRLQAVPRRSGDPEEIGRGDSNEEGEEFASWSGADPATDYLLRIVLTDTWGRSLVGRQWVESGGLRVRRPTSRYRPAP